MQTDKSKESIPSKEKLVDVDFSAKNIAKQANSKFVTTRNN